MSTAAKEEEESQVKREEIATTSSPTVAAPTAAAEEEPQAKTNALTMKEKVALLTEKDCRAGWPKTRPPFDTMVHGWFFSSHEEVLLSLLDREKTCETSELHICIYISTVPKILLFISYGSNGIKPYHCIKSLNHSSSFCMLKL